MGYTDEHGHPIPFGFDGNNVPADYLAAAQRLDDIKSARTYAQIAALAGSDLWDRRILYQSDTGPLRPWKGLYEYKASTRVWQPLVPRGSAFYTPTFGFDTGQPTMGSGASQQGYYSRFGAWCLAQFFVFNGSSGYSNGSGFARWALPPGCTPAANPLDGQAMIGSIELFDGTPTWHVGSLVYLDSGGGAYTYAEMQAQTTSFVTSTVPFTWNNGSGATGTLFFETIEPA